MKKKKLLICFLIIVCITSLCAHASAESQSQVDGNLLVSTDYSNAPSLTGQEDRISKDMYSLERLLRYVDSTFLYEIDYDKVYEAMASALFEALDEKYSYYVPKDDTKAYEEDTLGFYGGLGFYFSKTFLKYQDPQDEQTLYCNIERTFPGSPSSQGGIKSRDMIIAIDGTSTIDLEADDCAKLMKGEPGTKVVLTIKRREQTFDLNLTRQIVTVPTIESCMLENNIGYIIINEFNQDTPYNFYKRLLELDSKGLKGLVIDLRSNGGGDFDAPLTIADLLLDQEELLSVEYKDTTKNQTFYGNKGFVIDQGIPIAILSNGGTASSSEALILCLRDNNRASLIGTKTFGKGIMQLISPFGDTYTSLTVAAFFGKNHQEFHGIGLEPDIVVDDSLSDEQMVVISQMLEDDVFNAYLDAYPVESDEAIERFAQEAGEKYELDTYSLQALMYSVYESDKSADDRIIANPKYDKVLQEAINHIQK